jgi:two-component system response regulator AtoC
MAEESKKILIIDDEKNLRESLAEFLALDGFSCSGAETGEKALSLLENEIFDAVVLDLRMPGMDGLSVLKKIREMSLALPVIMMSAHGEISDAVQAMKLGATDYLVKPFDPAELAIRLDKSVADSALIRMARVGIRLDEARHSGSNPAGGAWLGDDPAMKDPLSLIRRVAPAATTVLITGESGTGKEVVAREIHRLSPRAAGPFVPINVGAIPESLLESELFGFEKGAFTGADARKQGLFELASGGTLFLDELGEMPLLMQVKLLRVLQERTVMRVGGQRPIPIDVRIIAATNRDLEVAVREGKFREDLYFRVNVIRIRLPALRERPLDIAPFAGLFLSRFSREMAKPIQAISPEALHILASYPFPGNIRELENMIERAVILCESDTLMPEDFALEQPALQARPLSATSAIPVSVRDAEKQAIIAALERNARHRERTAAELGISRRTLLNKMKEYGLQD